MNAEQLKASILGEMISASQAKIAELEAQLATERIFLAALREKHGAIIGYSPSPNGVLAGAIVSAPLGTRISASQVPLFTDDTLEDGHMPQQILAVLTEAGRNLTVDEIVERVQARGFKTDAQKGTRGLVFSSLGRRRDLFRRVRRGVYGLAEQSERITDGRQE